MELDRRLRRPGPPAAWLLAAALLSAGCGTRPPDMPLAGAPTIDTFEANVKGVAAGGTVTFTWTASGFTSLRIEPEVGDVSAVSFARATPSATTTYWLVATNERGSVSAPLTVRLSAFTPGPSLQTARAGAGVSLLFGGKILVSGGETAGGPTDTAEIFEPDTGQFRQTAGKMAVARHGHLSMLLGSGNVLIAGGRNESGPLASMELYNTAADTFTTLGDMRAPREGFSAGLIDTGTRLFVGGPGDPPTSEIFTTSTLATVPGPSPLRARSFPAAWSNATTSFGPAQVYLLGGLDPLGGLHDSTERWDSVGGSFASGPNLREPRAEAAALWVATDKILLLGGRGFGGALQSMETVDFSTGGSSAITGQLIEARAGFVFTSLRDGRLFLVGGTGANGAPLASTEIFDPATGSTTAGPPMAIARRRADAVSTFDGQLFVIGGETASGPTASVEALDPW